MLSHRPLAVLLLMLCSSCVFGQTTVRFSSPTQRVPTIELFTSHGCSSCPPADNWLSQYVDHPGLWTQVIPMAFHVDYWDYLGWHDAFASRRHTQRQQNYASSGRIDSVYTPGLVVQGREWRGFFRRSEPDLQPAENVGVLQLQTDLESAQISFIPISEDSGTSLTAHIAILGFGIESEIAGGENRGRILDEDFVVLGHTSAPSQATDNRWKLSLPSTVPVKTRRRAIIAWVSAQPSPAPLQATGGWLPDND